MTKDCIEIIYEDESILLVNKPNNLIVHQSKFGGQIDSESLCQLLNKQFDSTVHPIHRLDRKTSGVMLFSKQKHLIPTLQDQFYKQTIVKKYIALVRGYVIESGKIDSPIKPEDKQEYKEALTLYKPILHANIDIPVTPYPTSRYTLLELTPKTGRTHQLRKHCNKISHPIIGDAKYGNRHHNHMFIDEFSIPNLFLHASSLSLNHPISGTPLYFQGKLPDFWLKTVDIFKWEKTEVLELFQNKIYI